jgi:hypothetical protein
MQERFLVYQVKHFHALVILLVNIHKKYQGAKKDEIWKILNKSGLNIISLQQILAITGKLTPSNY